MELRPHELLRELKAGKFRPAYLFLGEDAAGKLEALSALKTALQADDFNLREFSGEAGSESAAIVSEAATLPVFSDRRLVIVKNPRLPPEARSLLAAYLKDPLLTTTLVLFSDERKPDPKDALTRAAASAGAVCLFAPLREEEAVERLRSKAQTAGRAISEEAASALVAEAGTDWGILSQELEKALLFSKPRNEVAAEDVLQCLGYQKAADPFALSRLIQSRRLKESLEQLRRTFKDGKADEQAFRALSQIAASVAKQLRAKRLASTGASPEEIFKALRLNAYYDRDYLLNLSRLTEKRLVRDLKRCLKTEAALKSKSWLDPRIELQHLVVDLCSNAA